MNTNLQKYETFLDYIRKGHNRKAQAFERENLGLLRKLEKTSEGEKCFASFQKKYWGANFSGRYLLYCIFDRAD